MSDLVLLSRAHMRGIEPFFPRSDPQHDWKIGGGVFARTFAALAAKAGVPERLSVDRPHLKAHRPAATLLQEGAVAVSADPRAG